MQIFFKQMYQPNIKTPQMKKETMQLTNRAKTLFLLVITGIRFNQLDEPKEQVIT